ncbi:hypothetical protein RI820_000858 [Pluralibacter gergoviae]|nr:hypothetical protein [Pluralibacter gergoviae]ELC3016005.1 hypothetical protein [Pluralibacter gergoviae]ELC3020984.1 hypothetical protein [Pluralibacter gergoviae]
MTIDILPGIFFDDDLFIVLFFYGYYCFIKGGGMFKKLLLATSLLSAVTPAFAATPSLSWKLPGSEELNQITFGVTINAAAARDQFYFANQFSFTNGGDIGYTGIQPTVNTQTGERQFRVLFSSFRSDSFPQYPTCSGGADGAKAGTTCRILVPGSLGDTFRFEVTKVGERVSGVVENLTTGRKDIIGVWTVGTSAGSLAHSQIAWIENYKMNNANYKLTCDSTGWPYYEVKFLPPTGNDGKIQGTISGLNRGSDACPGAISWTTDSTGTLVHGGF